MRSILERFEEKFIPEPNSGCWLWTAGLKVGGYGGFRIGDKKEFAHRVSWALYKKEPIEDLNVLHKCDVTICVNPDHLFLGDHFDNMQDKILKGRGANPAGERHHAAKLTESDIRKIRLLLRAGGVHTRIARMHGVTKSTIGRIASGKIWSSYRGP